MDPAGVQTRKWLWLHRVRGDRGDVQKTLKTTKKNEEVVISVTKTGNYEILSHKSALEAGVPKLAAKKTWSYQSTMLVSSGWAES